MREIRFGKTSAMLAIILLLGGSVLAGGGGSGSPLTPYGSKEPTLAEIIATREAAAKLRAISDLRIVGSKGSKYLSKISFGWRDANNKLTDQRYDLVGEVDQVTRSISLADIRSIVIKQSNTDTVVARTKLFTTATPNQIANSKWSYQELPGADAVLDVVLRLKGKNGDLVIIGDEFEGPRVYKVADVMSDTTITLDTDSFSIFWWATPSIANSPGYPFRNITAD